VNYPRSPEPLVDTKPPGADEMAIPTLV